MRLINTLTLELVEFLDDIPLYAILSHRWVRTFCSLAASHGLEYAWVDTCCIDKTSSAELSEAINSMYRWYEESVVCFAFPGDTFDRDPDRGQKPDLAGFNDRYPWFHQSDWFTRGWTLQELIAPAVMGTKSTLAPIIAWVTGIPEAILNGESPQTASVAQRMSWASMRQTIRVEDKAYCLMGLFNVNIPMLYGEGEKAFIRLQEEIIKKSDDHAIFAWENRWKYRDHPSYSGLLADSPRAFETCGEMVMVDLPVARNLLNRVISTDNKGIHLKLPFRPTSLETTRPDGETALSYAILNKKYAAAKLLIEMRVDIHAVNRYGKSALHYAANYGCIKIVTCLIDQGVDIGARDVHGNLAVDMPYRFGSEEIGNLLKSAMICRQENSTDRSVFDCDPQTFAAIKE
ncbi:hypothetical protein QBC38DRAFT_512515 [Podospora fimiseda]|uniref:Heterokaryon incompatibility domain-containing protein n=1 Tax=Podospora fimiseda TaxID=252190 RepID=A0AAN7BH45_9PEZI|nr:hypothetical protein QBC38DRAFT_512515 [Podospora fimiseda]